MDQEGQAFAVFLKGEIPLNRSPRIDQRQTVADAVLRRSDPPAAVFVFKRKSPLNGDGIILAADRQKRGRLVVGDRPPVEGKT